MNTILVGIRLPDKQFLKNKYNFVIITINISNSDVNNFHFYMYYAIIKNLIYDVNILLFYYVILIFQIDVNMLILKMEIFNYCIIVLSNLFFYYNLFYFYL